MKQITRYSVLKTIRIYIIGILVYMGAQTLILHRLGLDWEVSFIDAGITAVVLAFYCFDLICIFTFYQPGKENGIYRFLFVLVFSLLNTATSGWALKKVLHLQAGYIDFVEKSLPVRFGFSLLIFLFVTAIYWLWNSLNDQREREKRRVDTEQLAKEAELAGLRQKLQPHFLFNSLNSISALAVSKPQEARKMIQQLSDFLRGTLKKDEQLPVALKDELAHLNLYLEIEKVRFGHRLNIENHIEEGCTAFGIPSLLLQPIVENAIKFGLYDTLEPATIVISASSEHNYLVIKISNPFDAATQNANTGTGFGLTSVQRRLFLLYSRNDLLILEKQGNTFSTTLKIPQQVLDTSAKKADTRTDINKN